VGDADGDGDPDGEGASVAVGVAVGVPVGAGAHSARRGASLRGPTGPEASLVTRLPASVRNDAWCVGRWAGSTRGSGWAEDGSAVRW
jgi:hypothetical protein